LKKRYKKEEKAKRKVDCRVEITLRKKMINCAYMLKKAEKDGAKKVGKRIIKVGRRQR
jgi:hypothetical protein